MADAAEVSLLLRSGELVKDPWWKIFSRGPELPPVGAGEQIVVRDAKGMCHAGASLSQGAVARGNMRSWYVVDCSPRTYSFLFAEVVRTAQYSFSVSISVRASVKDAREVVQRGLRSLDDEISPQIARETVSVLTGFKASKDELRSKALTSDRATVENALFSRLALDPSPHLFPGWVDGAVVGVKVILEDADIQHFASVWDQYRVSEMLEQTAINDVKAAGNKVTIRNLWRKQLGKELSNGAMAIFETVYDDPTPQKIASALAKAEAAEQQRLRLVFDVLLKAISEGLMTDGSSIAELQDRLLELDRAFGGSTQEIGAESMAVDAETVAAESEDSAKGSTEDRDF